MGLSPITSVNNATAPSQSSMRRAVSPKDFFSSSHD
jgi:hypothetical protein